LWRSKLWHAIMERKLAAALVAGDAAESEEWFEGTELGYAGNASETPPQI